MVPGQARLNRGRACCGDSWVEVILGGDNNTGSEALKQDEQTELAASLGPYLNVENREGHTEIGYRQLKVSCGRQTTGRTKSTAARRC